MLFQLVNRLPEAQLRVIHMRFVEQRISGRSRRKWAAVKAR